MSSPIRVALSRILLVCCSVVALCTALASTPPDSFEMRQIAQIPYWPWGEYVCGDADHDGYPEYYCLGDSGGGESWVGYAVEYAGGNEFTPILLGGEQLHFSEMGDADQDGLTELLYGYDSFTAGRVFAVAESRDTHSLPDTIVWAETIPGMSYSPNAVIADFDRDGAQEIVFNALDDQANYHLRMYECTGDNRYELKTKFGSGGSPNRACDIDRNGWLELAVCRGDGCGVYVYEAVSDDSFRLKATVPLPPDSPPGRAVASAQDMDRDGRPELIALGKNLGTLVSVAVIESPRYDAYEVVWSTQVSGSILPPSSITVGDIDGDSVPEFAVTDGINVRLFRCTGNDQYEECWRTCNHEEEVKLYDINSDGKCELLYRYGETTIICEYIVVGVAERELRKLQAVQVQPSVATTGQAVRLSGLESRFGVQVLDASGRIVLRPRSGTINPRSLAPGAYFVRITSGNQSAVSKLLIVE